MSRQLSIFEQLEFCTTRIEGQDANKNTWSGTGFFFNLNLDGSNTMPLVITNKHVVENAVQLTIQFSKADTNDDPLYTEPFKVVVGDMSSIIYHPDFPANVNFRITA